MARKHKGFRVSEMVRLAGIEFVKQRIRLDSQNTVFPDESLQIQPTGSPQGLAIYVCSLTDRAWIGLCCTRQLPEQHQQVAG